MVLCVELQRSLFVQVNDSTTDLARRHVKKLDLLPSVGILPLLTSDVSLDKKSDAKHYTHSVLDKSSAIHDVILIVYKELSLV